MALLYLGDLEGNVEEIERFVGSLKDRPGGLDPSAEARFAYLVGGLLVRRGEEGRAIERLRSAVALDDGFVAAHHMLANALGRSGRHAEALPHFTAVLAADPESHAARVARAASLYHLGRFGDAVVDLEAAVELAPENARTKSQLAAVRQRLAAASRTTP